MQLTQRCVLPELLDNLPAEDPRAVRSRRDLRRVHRAMRSVSILRHAAAQLRLSRPPRRIIELGAGDGTLLLRLARTLNPRWTGVELTLLDRQRLVTPDTEEAYRRLDWRVSVLCTDVFEWARTPTAARYDLCIAALFLHHFNGRELDVLLPAVALRTQAFIACEPRRDLLGRLGSLGIGLIGANEVTRADAVKSVAAGFQGGELSTVWRLATGNWIVEESRALPFTHRFSAVRRSARGAMAQHAG